MTTTKQNRGSRKLELYVVLAVSVIAQVVIFGMVTFMYYRYLMKTYFNKVDPNSTTRRINDIKAILKPLSIIAFGPNLLLIICLYILAQSKDNSSSAITGMLVFEIPLIFIWLWLSFILFKWLALAHFGVIVDPEKDRVVFRFDQESYDWTDYLKLKFIRDIPKVDVVKLSDIGRITRQFGKSLYLHGSFGSRRITFTNKQKRDECIFAITSSGKTSAKVAMEFERT